MSGYSRHEWLPPETELSEDDRARAASYLERQARFDLAVWVAYRSRPGGTVDHELMLRLRGRRPGRRELSSLFWGVSHEMVVHAYIGIPTRAEMKSVRRAGELVWERVGPVPDDADPLAFRSITQQITVPSALRAAICEAMGGFPAVRRVGVTHSQLWKGSTLFSDNINFGVECDGPTGFGKGPVGAVSDLINGSLGEHLRELMTGPRTGLGVTMSQYRSGARPATVYRRNGRRKTTGV